MITDEQYRTIMAKLWQRTLDWDGEPPTSKAARRRNTMRLRILERQS